MGNLVATVSFEIPKTVIWVLSNCAKVKSKTRHSAITPTTAVGSILALSTSLGKIKLSMSLQHMSATSCIIGSLAVSNK